ncbi:DUF1802 family protein [Phormidium sp. CLA17]|uniref:DUF1802 family protein n=1 Tax=Leptolyngbya sp. Cla-17 TaxID=2803751 RepID=UPI0014918DF9|nr:DUF1802 family protein [Leptolyngbya sp. Cla-17]MBM0740597.1 DUF1802 family protein [Leptolyngbya sp. Cla-17]
MTDAVYLDRALCLPAPDIAALLHGQLIAVIPNVPVQKGWTFLLYPCAQNGDALPIEQQYRSHILPLARTATFQQQSETVEIEAWAKCEGFKVLHEAEQLEALSSLSIWTKDALKQALKQRQRVFLAFLRVHRVPDCIKLTDNVITPDKFGKFVGLTALDKQFDSPLKIIQILPVLNGSVFNQRMKQLEELRPSLNPELEELQGIVSQFASINPAAKCLEKEVRVFLGWANDSKKIQPDSDMTWITSIAKVGNSSDGDLFEKLVRKSLVKLGFKNSNANPQASLDPSGCGGAGGLDFYCEEPYPIVGECKATKTESVPDSTPAQLVKLGLKHLENYDKCIKIIMAAGALNTHAKQTSVGNKMNVLRPETLQRLVELKAKHQGSINLMELKPCLESAPFGEDADVKVNGYIDQAWNGIKVRAHIVKAVKQLIEIEPHRTQFEVVEIRAQYNAAFSRLDGSSLDNQTVHEFLIELSSPLAGYLGRVQGTSLQTDRFYFLRDLVVD